MAKFKTIGKTPENEIVNVSEPVYDLIVQLSEKLADDLGFYVTHSQALAWLLNVKAGALPETMRPAEVPALDRIASDLKDLMSVGKKIDAIKLVRQVSGMGLKESKEYVEKHWQHLCDAYRRVNPV